MAQTNIPRAGLDKSFPNGSGLGFGNSCGTLSVRPQTGGYNYATESRTVPSFGMDRSFIERRFSAWCFGHAFAEYGSETCSLKSAANEKIEPPANLFTVTFDPNGRVIMSASWADLQAIAKEAGVTLDPSKLRWRFSHMNEMLDGIPQDVFPEP